jgi:hypothetical protein
MSTAPRYQPHYTVDDYAHWEGQWELWHGVAVAMSPSPFGRHAKLLARTVAALQTAIDSAGCHATVLVEIDWIVSRDTVLRPDVIVVCGLEQALCLSPDHRYEDRLAADDPRSLSIDICEACRFCVDPAKLFA